MRDAAPQEPILIAPQPLITPKLAAPVITSLVIAGLLGGTLMLGQGDQSRPVAAPASRGVLSTSLVTVVDRGDQAGILAAVSRLAIEPGAREQVRADIEAGRREIGWIVFTDSMVVDGDVVQVDSAGVAQVIELTSAWQPVPIVLQGATPITITGIRDGGGGITVALATRSGSVPLAIMTPGQQIQVVAR